MVKYHRNIPLLDLVDFTRKKAFDKDIEKKEYQDANSSYKCEYQKDKISYAPVKTALKEIYRNKCAYCETKFTRSYINIEHYRPKRSEYYSNNQRLYHFLAYSWSNLLPICAMCNTKKSNSFKIEDESKRAKYNDESLVTLQYITKKLNDEEKPLFIHPDIDEYKGLFRFNLKGKMVVNLNHIDKERMIYTIKTSDLNEDDLKNRRAEVFEEFRLIKIELLHLFISAKKYKDSEELSYFKNKCQEKIEIFFNDTKEFIAVRMFIIKRLNSIFKGLDKWFIGFFESSLNEYIKTVEVYNN